MVLGGDVFVYHWCCYGCLTDNHTLRSIVLYPQRKRPACTVLSAGIVSWVTNCGRYILTWYEPTAKSLKSGLGILRPLVSTETPRTSLESIRSLPSMNISTWIGGRSCIVASTATARPRNPCVCHDFLWQNWGWLPLFRVSRMSIVSSLTNHPTSAVLAVALRTTLCSTQHSTMTWGVSWGFRPGLCVLISPIWQEIQFKDLDLPEPRTVCIGNEGVPWDSLRDDGIS